MLGCRKGCGRTSPRSLSTTAKAACPDAGACSRRDALWPICAGRHVDQYQDGCCDTALTPEAGVIDRVAMAAPAAAQSAAALGAFFGKRPSGCHRQNLMIAAASQRTRRLRFANMVNIVAEEAAMLDN